MNLWTLILRNLRYYRLRHVGTVLGAATATAILTAALVVGDSVRGSLRRLALVRLGRTEYAVEGGDRRFRVALAGEMERATGRAAAALIAATGAASAPDTGRRAPRVQVLGVDGSLDRFADAPPGFASLSAGEAMVNEALARRLGVKPGDSLVLRLARAGPLPADVPLAGAEEPWTSLRTTVRAVLDDRRLGRFSLRATQVAGLSVFVPRSDLTEKMDLANKANVLLVASEPNSPSNSNAQVSIPARPRNPNRSLSLSNSNARSQALARLCTLEDFDLALRPLTHTAGWELRSGRIFLDPPAASAAFAAAPGAGGIFTYFVNELRAGERACPYSMVAAPAPVELADGEIAVNEWLAEDLGIGPGAEVALRFFILGPRQGLEETSRVFRVRAVLPIAGAAADPSLMPDFPGIGDTSRCSDWKPGIPVDLSRIRDKDEAYWSEHRGTPKAFVTLASAQAMWANRFGALTAVRWPGSADGAALAASVRAHLTPESAGLVLRPVREEGLRAGSEGVDFAGLFVGLGFFIIVAALVLAALLFAGTIEARAEEIGILRATGFPPARVRRVLLGEALLLAAAAAALGGLAGVAVTDLILQGLRTVWRGVVGTSALALEVRPLTVAWGAAGGLAAAWLTAAAVLRRQSFRSIRELQAAPVDPGFALRRRRTGWRLALAVAGLGGAAAAMLLPESVLQRRQAATFLAAGALALGGGLAGFAWCLARLSAGARSAAVPAVFGPRNWARRARRSLAAVIMPACGLFLVLAVGSYRPDLSALAVGRDSGTGGYSLYGETALPLVHDPTTAEGRRFFGLQERDLVGVDIAMLRLREGDDASCLNLNRVSLPPLLGVPADAFRRRGSFRFVKLDARVPPDDPWKAVELDLGPGVMPAVADASVLQWGLGKALGDRLTVVDEQGRRIDLHLAGALADSVFQGRLLISQDAMQRHFPSSPARVLLVDAAGGREKRVRRVLEDRMGDLGLDLSPAVDRLAAFLAVQQTYLDIFLLFGALGLLIGAAGFGVVAGRDIRERRREFAVLSALGFRRRRILAGVTREHIGLAAAGMALGAAASALALLPSLLAAQARAPLRVLGGVVLGLLLSAALSTGIAVAAALHAPPLQALREE